MELSLDEQQWLDQQRLASRRVFVGIDHHTTQMTVAAAIGSQLIQRPDLAQIQVQRLPQTGEGYRRLQQFLQQTFPETDLGDFYFLSEPSYAQPLCHFLRSVGFVPEQLCWVKTTKVGAYRKSNDLSRCGKNDDQDSRTLMLMLFDGLQQTGTRLHLFPAHPVDSLATHCKYLTTEYQHGTQQAVKIQNQIFHLVLHLFPEMQEVFTRTESRRKPDGSHYAVQVFDLFGSVTPLRILQAFPTPQALSAAGMKVVWAQVGKVGMKKAQVQQLVNLAAHSGGVPDELAVMRLVLLLTEYQATQTRLAQYRDLLRQQLEKHPVFTSCLTIAGLSEVILATLVGGMGSLEHCPSADHLKSYLNLAPKPMPQTGIVDAQGKVVQAWRMPANSYKAQQGKRRLLYEIPGQKAPRTAAWLWFDLLVRNQHHCPNDPFVQLYQRYKTRLQGQQRWLGRVRWKVVGKLITVLYTCCKTGQPYDPRLMITQVG